MKIYNSVLLFILCSSPLQYAMQLILLPNDVLTTIFKFSHPPIDVLYKEIPNLQEKDKTTSAKNFLGQLSAFKRKHEAKKIAETIIDLRSTNKQFNTFISHDINAYLGLNKNNINTFLIRATVAHIPYFIHIALPIKLNPDIMADPNCIDKIDGFTPLLYATTHGHYPTCKLLIEKGADVNKKSASPQHIDFYLDPQQSFAPFFYPVGIAIKNGNTKIVSLFLENGAHLDKYIHIEKDSYGSALYVAVKRNNPYTIALLLNANPVKNKGGIQYWLNGNLWKHGTIDVENALKKLIEHNALDKLNKLTLECLQQDEEFLNLLKQTKDTV